MFNLVRFAAHDYASCCPATRTPKASIGTTQTLKHLALQTF